MCVSQWIKWYVSYIFQYTQSVSTLFSLCVQTLWKHLIYYTSFRLRTGSIPLNLETLHLEGAWKLKKIILSMLFESKTYYLKICLAPISVWTPCISAQISSLNFPTHQIPISFPIEGIKTSPLKVQHFGETGKKLSKRELLTPLESS